MEKLLRIEGRKALLRYFKIQWNAPILNEPPAWIYAVSLGIGFMIPFVILFLYAKVMY